MKLFFIQPQIGTDKNFAAKLFEKSVFHL